MEHYIEIIIILAPGFIAKETATLLGNIKSDKSSINQVMNYFVYSLFAIIPLVALYWYLGVPHDGIYLIYILLAVVSGVVVGALWQLFLKQKIRKMCEKITVDIDGYVYFQEDTLVNFNLFDGKDHLVIIKKGGEVIATGPVLGLTYGEDKFYEIKIDNHTTYREWLSMENASEKFPYKCTYIDVTNDLVIDEYEFPEDFFSEGYNR